MGFFSDLKEDLSQAVNELMPEDALLQKQDAEEIPEEPAVIETLKEETSQTEIPVQEPAVSEEDTKREDLIHLEELLDRVDSIELPEDMDITRLEKEAALVQESVSLEETAESVSEEPTLEESLREAFGESEEDLEAEEEVIPSIWDQVLAVEPEAGTPVSEAAPEPEPEPEAEAEAPVWETAPEPEPEPEAEAPVWEAAPEPEPEPEPEAEAPVWEAAPEPEPEPEPEAEAPVWEAAPEPEPEPEPEAEAPVWEAAPEPEPEAEAPVWEVAPEPEPEAEAPVWEAAPEPEPEPEVEAPVWEADTEDIETVNTTIENEKEEEEEKMDMEMEMSMGMDMGMDLQAKSPVDETAIITAGMTVTGDIVSEGSMEVIGTINGNISILGKLNITGTIQGNSKAAEIYADNAKINGEIVSEGAVKIGQSSVIIGNISAQSAVIAGAVKGDIDVHGPVVLDTSAIVMGNIKSKAVQINNGAVIEGMCSQCYADVSPTTFFDEYKKSTKAPAAKKDK